MQANGAGGPSRTITELQIQAVGRILATGCVVEGGGVGALNSSSDYARGEAWSQPSSLRTLCFTGCRHPEADVTNDAGATLDVTGTVVFNGAFTGSPVIRGSGRVIFNGG